MNLSFVKTSTMLVRWILLFEREAEDDESNFLIFKDLYEAQLKNFYEGISEICLLQIPIFKMKEYNALVDPLNIIKPSGLCEDVDIVREKSAEKDNNDHVARYMTMKIPVTKSIFLKAINASLENKITLSDSEIYDILDHLILFLDNKIILRRVICQQLLNDGDLYNRLKICSMERSGSNQQKNLRFEMAYKNLIAEMQNEMYVVVKDEYSNFAFVSSIDGTKSEPPLYANTLSILYHFPKCILKTTSTFIFRNRKLLYKTYNEVPFHELHIVIDIDFSDIACHILHRSDHMISLSDSFKSKIRKILKCKFLTFQHVKKVILRFARMRLNFDLSFLSNPELELYIEDCVLKKGFILPKRLKKLTICDSSLSISMILPITLENISMKRSQIKTNNTLNVNIGCIVVDIEHCSGHVCVPQIEKMLNIQFGEVWSIKITLKNDECVDILKVVNGTFKNTMINISQEVKTLILKEVKFLPETQLIVRSHIESIILTRFTGTVHFHSLISNAIISITITNGSMILSKSKQNYGMLKFMLHSAIVMSTNEFNERVSKLDMKNVNIMNNNYIKIHKNTRNISLENISGQFLLDNIYGFQRIDLASDGYFYLRTLDQHQTFSVLSCLYRGNELVLENTRINNSIFLGPSIKRLKLKNIVIAENCSLRIDNDIEGLKIKDCTGKFKIPFISHEHELMINFTQSEYSLEITKTSVNAYSITAINMIIEISIFINVNISDLNLQNVLIKENAVLSLNYTCINVSLNNLKGRLNIRNSTALDTLVLHNMDFTENASILAIPINRFEACNLLLSHHVIIPCVPTQFKHHESIYSSMENILRGIPLNNLKNFLLNHNRTSINLIHVLRNVGSSESRFLVNGFVKLFNEDGLENCTKLKLKNFQILNHVEIVKDVKILHLSHVRSANGSTLRLNKEVECLRMKCTTVDIDITRAIHLKSITIWSSLFIYDCKAYQSLTYLYLSKLEIGQNVCIGNTLQTLKLHNVVIKRSCMFKIGKNVSYLSIEKSSGVMHMSGVGGLRFLVLNEKNTIRYRRALRTPKKYAWYFADFCFEGDIQFSNDSAEIVLERCEIAEGVKLLFGEGCKSVKLDVNRIDLNGYNAVNLEKITLTNVLPHILNKAFMLGSLNTLTIQNFKVTNVIKCADHIRTVILQMVDVVKKRTFHIGENCEEIHFIYCTGVFNLATVRNLKKLVIIPQIHGKLFFKNSLHFLHSVLDLEMAYNFESSFLQAVLVNCISVVRLTLHSLKYRKSIQMDIFAFISFKNILNISCSDHWLKEKFPQFNLARPSLLNADRAMIINLKMNALFNELITFEIRNRLQHLNLVGFSISKKNGEQLKLFQNLKTLIVDYYFIDENFFSFLPSTLEALEIVETNIFFGANCTDKNANFALKM
ncbi:putative LRR containing protein [Trachipleistophora hominis]|uniref:Putative LRR containing protein n=1 Tax=Trachipleistophora hominis TaxID=72359 RepID=L7JSK9_TRAHO|nr:putative LRR containing protein [Trachipleistophora hominis]